MASRSIDSSGLRSRRLRDPVSGGRSCGRIIPCDGAARLGAWSGRPARCCRASWSASTSAVLPASRSAGPGSRAARRRRARVARHPRYGDAAVGPQPWSGRVAAGDPDPCSARRADRDGDPDGALTVDVCGLLQRGCQGARCTPSSWSGCRMTTLPPLVAVLIHESPAADASQRRSVASAASSTVNRSPGFRRWCTARRMASLQPRARQRAPPTHRRGRRSPLRRRRDATARRIRGAPVRASSPPYRRPASSVC